MAARFWSMTLVPLRSGEPITFPSGFFTDWMGVGLRRIPSAASVE